MQPLDVSFMKPLMSYYTQAIENWLRNHPGRVVTTFQTAGLFRSAYVRAATMTTAVNGFRKTGIWPIDRNVFGPGDFAGAAPTDIELRHDVALQPQATEVGPVTPVADVGAPRAVDVRLAQQTDVDPHALLAVSVAVATRGTADIDMVSVPSLDMLAPAAMDMDLATDINGNGIGSPRRNQNATSVAITTVSPIPKVTEQTPIKSHRRGKTCIITLSPYKQQLEQTESHVVQGSATTQHKRNHPSKQAEVCKDTATSQTSTAMSKQDDTACLYCCEQFVNSRKGEKWIECGQCKGWAYEDCTDYEGGTFTCDICEDD